ncbi:MAG: patatin-like phospholipase family protein [Alphaproteobacteria bacterium]
MAYPGIRGGRAARWAAGLALCGAVAGCAVNRPLDAGVAAAPAYRDATLAGSTDLGRNSEEILVILALSGGGARAAAFGFGVLEALSAASIRPDASAPPRSVLAEVDLISANSGGAFVAAYYAVHREAMFRADAGGQTPFERDFLKRRLSAELLASVMMNLGRINRGEASRTDVAAEHFGATLFGGRTFADLARQGRPYLVINAHDTTKRARFEFTQEQFDLICSDLGSVPLARAVVASSAVHGVFTPLRLRNHARAHCPPEPAWIAAALRGEGDPASVVDSPSARRSRALLARWYRDKLPDGQKAPPETRFFVHLADGAAADNLGLRAPILALASRDSAFGYAEKIRVGRIKRVLLIAVNAATGPDPMRDADEGGPSALQTMRDAADGLIRTVSDATLREAQLVLAQLRAGAARNGGMPEVYGPVVIDFDAVADERQRRCFKRLPTTFDLPAADVDALREAGRALLAAAPEFRRFLAAQNGAEARLAALPSSVRFCAGP